MNKNTSPRLNTDQAAEYLGISPKTLIKWRSTGEHSIPFLRFGQSKQSTVRYNLTDLDEFLRRSRSVAT
jgi:excisionase family DNA binding protein